jgi:hypothetical protein
MPTRPRPAAESSVAAIGGGAAMFESPESVAWKNLSAYRYEFSDERING